MLGRDDMPRVDVFRARNGVVVVWCTTSMPASVPQSVMQYEVGITARGVVSPRGG